MGFLNAIQAFLEKYVAPVAQKLSQSKIINAITGGMMASMPITLGVALFAILANLPIGPWQDFLTTSGMGPHMLDIVAATTSLLSIYIVPCIAYHYTKNERENGLTGAVLALAAFIIMMPQKVVLGDQVISAYAADYLGSNGIFVGMLIAILVSICYTKLMKMNIKLKLPDSVPPNVSESMSPTFVAIILFTGIFVVRYCIGLTSYGNLFDLINKLVTGPVMLFGTSPWSLILFYLFMNLTWFFGIHPNAILSVYLPVLMTAGTANTEAFLAGTPSAQLPYLTFALVGSFAYIGGCGNTISLIMTMFTAKSERYKVLRNIAAVPNVFNINEPMIFGMPIMLNPLFFIPMLATSLVGGLIGMFALDILHVGNAFNPTISLPWVMPSFVTPFITGGWQLGIAVVITMFVQALIWLPFFKVADSQAYQEEQASEKN